MSDYVVGTRVRVLATGEVGTVEKPLGGSVYSVIWDAPINNDSPLRFRYYCQDWLDTMCVVVTDEPKSPFVVGAKIKNLVTNNAGTITKDNEDGTYLVEWGDATLYMGGPGRHSRSWLHIMCDVVTDEPEESAKCPHTWVTIMEPVKVKLEKCPFCGGYSQKLVDGLVICDDCSAHAYVEDWNRRS